MPSRPRLVSPDAWSDPRHRLGLWGEREAAAYLVALGWHIEAMRFRVGRHDLDLVARRGRTVVFVEVKARGSRAYGGGEAAVHWRKQRIVARLAACWIDRFARPADEFRFDVIAVYPGTARGPEIVHLESAWLASP